MTCFDLLRTMPDLTFRHRYAGGGVAQGLALGQDAGKLNAIQLNLALARGLLDGRSRSSLLVLCASHH